MEKSQLDAFENVPFYVWAKDDAGVYLWANKRMDEYAGTRVAGKTDYDISAPDVAASLQADDKIVAQTDTVHTFNEQVDDPKRGRVTLSVCKYPGELDGKRCVFGVSFFVETS
ncbi:hypothetical protein Mag101_08455 [Microbulbifer agarilyticus]|uniref:PAS fold-4 domain-containing protein n=1 Tax=Microbulbifer agarilyticus TaxID=260552 RepID=A0A1Q2M4L5_9GAMM|nr:PAS domain-containing protein [Microbulbifer agarilyticus]AQQ67664.1 hypothetical protein Mag101_08455 [Microbulbifer agarilyticus]